MKKYNVTFKEIYEYTKTIEIEDNENIDDVIHDPLECPTVRDMDDDEFEELNPYVCNEYNVVEV